MQVDYDVVLMLGDSVLPKPNCSPKNFDLAVKLALAQKKREQIFLFQLKRKLLVLCLFLHDFQFQVDCYLNCCCCPWTVLLLFESFERRPFDGLLHALEKIFDYFVGEQRLSFLSFCLQWKPNRLLFGIFLQLQHQELIRRPK